MKIRAMLATHARSAAAPFLLALIVPAVASAHATVSPAVSLAGKLQLYSLAVPTEKSGLSTAKVVLTVPEGFDVDSFVPPAPGWRQRVQQSGSGDSAAVTRVSWTGGKTPTGEDSLFQFLAEPNSARSYAFDVTQTYSDGSIVHWTGSEASEEPAPAVDAVRSLGGGGTSTLTIIALILGGVGLVFGGFALLAGVQGRELA